MKKKLSIIAVMAGFVLIIVYLLFSNNDLKKQLQEKPAKETVHPDQQLEDRLDEFYQEEQEEVTATEKIRELAENFMITMYQAPSGEYGQVPYVQELLSDQGIRNLLFRMDPEKYADVPNELIENIRSATADKSVLDTALQTIAKEIYVSLSEDRITGDVLIFADVSFADDTSLATTSILLQLTCVQEDSWKINEIKDFRQL